VNAVNDVLTGKQGDKHLSFLAHVRDNICANDPALLEYLLNWMARTVQRPQELGQIAVVLQGARGTGKSLFANTFGALFGQRYQAVTDIRRPAGSNPASDCVVLFCDEVDPLDRTHVRILKALLAEEERVIERMGVDAQVVPNHVHLILSSSVSWMGSRDDARRFFVLNVAGDTVPFTLHFGSIVADLQAGGLSNLLYALQTRELTGFDVRALPPPATWWPKVDESTTNMSYARQVRANGDLACAVDIAAAISAIDVSRAATAAGDAGSAASSLEKARGLLAALIIDGRPSGQENP
jgi:hypothetical protein